MSSKGWIGVGLEGTLAEYKEYNPEHPIGKPIEPMMDRVKKWISEGRTVKIFTARAILPEQVPLVKAWLQEVGLGDLEVTNVKDFQMKELWDDRAIQVEKNTGRTRAELEVKRLIAFVIASVDEREKYALRLRRKFKAKYGKKKRKL